MRWPTPLTPIIIAKLLGGGGASVTPESVLYALQGMDSTQAGDALTAINGEANPTVVHDTSAASVTITPADNTIYKCGELASLTISNPPATGSYSIVFTSGATPTAAVIPPKPAMKWQTDDNEPPQGFPAANTRYEINVDDTYVVLGEWPVPAGE